MFRWTILLFSTVLLTAPLAAQQVILSNATQASVNVTVRVRNTNVDINSISGIVGVAFRFIEPNHCGGVCHFGELNSATFVGNVDVSPFALGNKLVVQSFSVLNFSYANGVFGPQLMTLGSETWGLLGCTRPGASTLVLPAFIYYGRTCLSEGYDGFLEVTTTFFTVPGITGLDARTYTERSFSASVVERVIVSPEPSTLWLTGVALVVLLATRVQMKEFRKKDTKVRVTTPRWRWS